MRDGFVVDDAGEFDPLGQGVALLRKHEAEGRTAMLITGKFG